MNATGVIELRDGRPGLVLQRTFPAPIEDVWASLTEPERLARWIGTWSGDPASGRVRFRMLAEAEPGSDDVPEEDIEIRSCQRPHTLQVTSRTGEGTWPLDVSLRETPEGTLVEFVHLDVDAEQAPQTGPGWEYYLDRWVAAITDADVDAIAFEPGYFPDMQEHYRQAFAAATG